MKSVLNTVVALIVSFFNFVVDFFAGEARNVRNAMKPRRLAVEGLENRSLLAAGYGVDNPVFDPPDFMPNITIENKMVEVGKYIGGQQDALLAEVAITADFPALLKGFQYIPAPGVGKFDQNFYRMTIWADQDGNQSNGFESLVGQGGVYYNGLTMSIGISEPVYVGDGPVHLQFKGTISTYTNGGLAGIKIVSGEALNLAGEKVPHANVDLVGEKPTLHFVSSTMWYISEREGDFGVCAVPGQTGLTVWDANSWGKGYVPSSISFVTTEGNFTTDGRNYTLNLDANWDGIPDAKSVGTVIRTGSTKELKFSLGDTFKQYGSRLTMTMDVPVTAYNPYFSVAVVPQSIKATDLAGSPLQGVAVGGGAGQIQFYSSNRHTVVSIISPPPALVIKEVCADPAYVNAVVGQEVVIEDVTMCAEQGAKVSSLSVSAKWGSFQIFSGLGVYVDRDGDGTMETKIASFGQMSGQAVDLVFAKETLEPGLPTRFQVRGAVADSPYSWSLRAQLSAKNQVIAEDLAGVLIPAKKKWVEWADQVNVQVNAGGLG